MTRSSTFIEELVAALHCASEYNRNDQIAPTAVLWPDGRRQWEPLLPLLRERLPLLTLGNYAPEQRTGPSYWLRCMIARTLTKDVLPEHAVPIIYLPGYGKQDLRAIEDCPKPLQPLAELQYRGTVWVHPNGRDWMVTGFLHSLDVPVGADKATKEALERALPRLVHEPLVRLRKRAPLYAPFFNELLHPDGVRQILLWLSDPDIFRQQLEEDEWAAFCAICRQKYAVDPETEGHISAAGRLGRGTPEWDAVWQRYVEAPEAYPGIPAVLSKAQPSQLSLGLGESSPVWPQTSRAAEDRLREALTVLNGEMPGEVRTTLESLEHEHGRRRKWVWAKLGRTPLVLALEHLVTLAALTETPLGGIEMAKLVDRYTSWGWQVDAALLRAMAAVEHSSDVKAVKSAALPLYRGWLREAAQNMQQVVLEKPQENYVVAAPPQGPPGACILFSDALRYDVGQRLIADLEERGLKCEVASRLAALPTVTATAKPVVSPAVNDITGAAEHGMTPIVIKTGSSVNATSLRNLISDQGWQILQDGDIGDPTGRGWTEMGAIDAYGHQHGWKVAKHVRAEVRVLADRVESLLQRGWKQVIVVTDHGWLMLPDGLPKTELPIHATEVRKGRCALLKPGVHTDQPVVSWHWNRDMYIAVARGIQCYEAGKEYEHGGISPQECILPVITVRMREDAGIPVSIDEVRWSRLRCYVQLEGASAEMIVDIRSKAAAPDTSLALEPTAPEPDGSVSLLVPNEEREGDAAFVVVTVGGSLRAQQLTTIGGE
ncbi:MAG: BREX-1 system phosphatase PglZ type B [bacterium]